MQPTQVENNEGAALGQLDWVFKYVKGREEIISTKKKTRYII